MIEIEFLGRKIYVRKGIAYLSHALNVPIVPVISYRSDYTENGIHIKFLPEIQPSKLELRDQFIKQTTQKLYRIVEDKVKEDPCQWDCWLSIGHAIDKKILENLDTPVKKIDSLPEKLTFNSDRYGLVMPEGSDFLFDIKTYQLNELLGSASYLINESMKGIKSDDYPKELLMELCSREILI